MLARVLQCVVLFGIAAVCYGSGLAHAHDKDDKEAKTALRALKEGDFGVALRYRFESVSDDNFPDRDGNASTLRTALGYDSARYRGWKLFAEFENVADLGLENDHNNLGAGALFNGVTNRPAVADPEITQVSQIGVAYRPTKRLDFAVGREEINIGDQRFVGAVGWRQHHQTFDLARAEIKTIPKTHLTYAYADRVHRIFGDSKPIGAHMLYAKIDAFDAGSLAVYGFHLDYDDIADANLSTQTFGARWTGEIETSTRWTVPYHLEYATQSDTGDNPGDVDADYRRIEVGGKRGRSWCRLGYELLEGDPTQGRFTTPLATLHKFNGWADKFLVTPATGLQDLFVAIGHSWGKFKGSATYHMFEADTGSLDYGDEIDILVTWKAPWDELIGLKYAAYSADQFSVDTDKLWLFTSYAFGR